MRIGKSFLFLLPFSLEGVEEKGRRQGGERGKFGSSRAVVQPNGGAVSPAPKMWRIIRCEILLLPQNVGFRLSQIPRLANPVSPFAPLFLLRRPWKKFREGGRRRVEGLGGKSGCCVALLRSFVPASPDEGKGEQEGGLKIKLHVVAGGLWGKRRRGGGQVGPNFPFAKEGKRRHETFLHLSCLSRLAPTSSWGSLFSERRNFFFAPVHFRLLPWRVRFFFLPGYLVFFIPSAICPLPFPFSVLCLSRRMGKKVPCLPPLFLLFLLNLNWMRVVCRVEKRPEAPSDRANWRRDGDGRHEKRKE